MIAGHPPVDADKSSLLLTTFNPLAPQRLVHLVWQDEIPMETREPFVRRARNRLPGASGRYPHNVPDLQISSRQLSISIRRQFTYGWKLKERQGDDKRQLPHVANEGLDVTKLRIMQTKAKRISRSASGWESGQLPPVNRQLWINSDTAISDSPRSRPSLGAEIWQNCLRKPSTSSRIHRLNRKKLSRRRTTVLSRLKEFCGPPGRSRTTGRKWWLARMFSNQKSSANSTV